MEIKVLPLFHRGQECIAVVFERNEKLNTIIYSLPVSKWSKTHHCWYIRLSEESYNALKKLVTPFATIDDSALKIYLREKKSKALLPPGLPPPAVDPGEQWRELLTKENNPTRKGAQIHPVNNHVLPSMFDLLCLKSYSASTIRTYINEMRQLLLLLDDASADALTTEHLRRYLIFCHEKLLLRENTLHSRINALKFYYEQVLKREKFFWEIPRPKKALLLPKVLSEEELGRLFRAIPNNKHRAIVFTAYSAGLRVSEVVNLKLRDVDSDRMTLFIERAKGKKDRLVNLSPLLLDILRAYIKEWKPRPLIYLFEGEKPGQPYGIRSAQLVFQQAKEKAGISKKLGFHALRHSFATHLLEKGVDIRYIKDILGHFDIKTTERYTHVSRQKLVNIISPLDDLLTRGHLTLTQPDK